MVIQSQKYVKTENHFPSYKAVLNRAIELWNVNEHWNIV